MSLTLSRTLLRLCALNVASMSLASDANKMLDVLAAAATEDWKTCLSTLDLHRLTPLAYYTLQQSRLLEQVPPSSRYHLQQIYQATLAMNTLRLLTLEGLLKKMASRHVTPVLWKGVVLADSFYPNLGTRPMDDIDFAIAPSDMEAATAVFQELGFTLQPHKTTTDAVYFANSMEMLCDVHHRVRLFEGKESFPLYLDLQPRKLTTPMRVLEPNAMVVHLIVHMDGHCPQSGPILLWLLDLALVLQQWSDRLDVALLQQLFPNKTYWVLLLRTIRFFETEWGITPPTCLATAAEAIAPLTLPTLLRQRRLAQWRLPSSLKGVLQRCC